MRLFHLVLAVCLFAALGPLACGREKPPETPAEQALPPKPKNADQVAREIVGGRANSYVYMNRLSGHPLSAKLMPLDELRPELVAVGIDPWRDMEQAFVSSTGITREDKAVVVAKHKLEDTQVKSALDGLVARSVPPGKWIDGLGAPSAEVSIKGHRRVVAMVAPSYVVILPVELASHVSKLAGTGGLPDYEGPEATRSIILQPSETLRAKHAPRIPETLSVALVTLTPAPDGGADIHVDAQSTSEAQAAADAEALTEGVARATTVKVAIVRIRVFKPVPFRPERDHVLSDVHLTPEEIDKLKAFAQLARDR